MGTEALSDAEFMAEFEALGARPMSKKYKTGVRSVYRRRTNIEAKSGRQLVSPNKHPNSNRCGAAHSHRLSIEVENGVVLICSDGHYWPGAATTAHRAFVRFCKELRPSLVIMNGDAFDGARVSRHTPIGWEDRPEVIQELEAVKERLAEIELATPRRVRLIYPLGNHDGRFETRLATVAPEYARIHGMHLKDHIGARWEPCWSAWINDDVVVKHRFKGGMHAAHNNTLWAGKTIITGHTHALKVSPMPDYNGVRWGIETGCIADAYGEQFVDYTEDNPRLWQSGFAALTFHNGRLLQPELVRVRDPDHVEWRGEVLKV